MKNEFAFRNWRLLKEVRMKEVRAALEGGEQFPAKHGRTGFRQNFSFDGEWNGRHYATKQIEAYAVEENGWLVITVIVKFF